MRSSSSVGSETNTFSELRDQAPAFKILIFTESAVRQYWILWISRYNRQINKMHFFFLLWIHFWRTEFSESSRVSTYLNITVLYTTGFLPATLIEISGFFSLPPQSSLSPRAALELMLVSTTRGFSAVAGPKLDVSQPLSSVKSNFRNGI